MKLPEYLRSRLHAQLLGAFLAFVFVAGAAMLAFLGWNMAKEPETGAILLDPAWIGSWVLIAGLILLAYASVTFGVLVAALHRYWSCRDDHRLFTLGAYLLLPVFPVGTVFSIYALWKLRSDNESANKHRTGAEAVH